MLVNQETVCFVLPKSLFGTSGKAFRVVHNGFLKCRNDVFEQIRVARIRIKLYCNAGLNLKYSFWSLKNGFPVSILTIFIVKIIYF